MVQKNVDNICPRHAGRAEVYFHSFLSPALDKGEWPYSHLGRFMPGGGTVPLNTRRGGALRASLNVLQNKRICSRTAKFTDARCRNRHTHQRPPLFINHTTASSHKSSTHRYEVLTVVTLRPTALRDVTPCALLPTVRHIPYSSKRQH